ncbi:alpha/beta hydrolase [Nocardia arthritidis]|uniref:DUF1023 domain-containing protein n=1 Tax=Nocardia arthritidis TaxID=228602 RepID=A0A6G9YBK8_9NOCA|nr:alpha/beta hydrolase [Nocardia arthritidis]QIS10611.1 hypothetical protein F5544_13615 [Nocardia arthritidis]
MATVAEIIATNPGALAAIAQSLTDKNRNVSKAMDQMRRDVDTAMDLWRGDAAAKASAKGMATHLKGSHITTAIDSQIEAIDLASRTLTSAHDTVVDWNKQAGTAGCAVAPDGHVTPPTIFRPTALDTSKMSPTELNIVSALLLAQASADEKARTIESHLLPAVRDFNDSDTAAAAALNKATDTVADLVHDPKSADNLPPDFQPILDMARGGHLPYQDDPRKFHEWWSGLTPAEKDKLAEINPQIGNIDGMPAVDRDHYNRLLLADLRAKGGPGKAGYDAVAGQLDGKDRFLLHLDDKGRAAIAINNPDTAANISTFVPGTGSKLEGIAGDMGRCERMLTQAKRAGAPDNTSVVCWYGYNAPPEIPDARDAAYAKAGAPALDSFQNGLRASHDGAPSYNTVVGHSYGTTLIGWAASKGNSLDADNVALVASPGTTVYRASDLNLTGVPHDQVAQHVWATTSRFDPIHLEAHERGTLKGLAWVAQNPVAAVVAPPVAASEVIDDYKKNPVGHYGTDPANAAYGGRTFTSDTVSPDKAHSAYWDIDNEGKPDERPNEALRNLGYLIANKPDQVH